LPGQKRVKEDWENIYYIGMGLGIVGGGSLLAYRPDTSCVGLRRQLALIGLQHRDVGNGRGQATADGEGGAAGVQAVELALHHSLFPDYWLDPPFLARGCT
jgi:hypothetical protein